MKPCLLFAVAGLSACGQSNENRIVLSQEKPPTERGYQSFGEEQLGIKSESADFSGRPGNGFGRNKTAPRNSAQAFGSVVSFAVPATQNKCNGAYAYETDPLKPSTVRVFFYTAAHCFEKVNPLGFAAQKLSGSTVGFASAVRFAPPYGRNNSLNADLSAAGAEVFYEGSTRSDVVRIFQAEMSLAVAQKMYLPSCARVETSNRKNLAIGATVVDDLGLIQANSKRDVKLSGLGIPVTDQIAIPNAGIGTAVQLEEVSSIPGESGGPVWLIDGRQKWDEMVEYVCLQGVVSREIISPRIKLGGEFELTIDSYFTPLMPTAGANRWVKIQ